MRTIETAAQEGPAFQVPLAVRVIAKSAGQIHAHSAEASSGFVPPWTLYSPWQRWGFLAILFLVITSNYFDYFVLSVLLEPIKHEFHVSDTMLGLLSGFSFALFYAATALPIARWADRGNRRSVITLTLAGWSVMTAVCGLARSFWQLVAARLGVGLMEPGALPPAQSLVADYFPPERRATAIAFLTMGASAVGWVFGVGVGGYMAAAHGWRSAFLMAGVPGLVLAVIVRFTLAEPRSDPKMSRAPAEPESLVATISHLLRKRSFVWILVGTSVYLIFGYGVTVFLPSFMVRALHASVAQISGVWGCTIAAADALGGLSGGWLADRLSRRDIRWYSWLPAIGCLVGMLFYGLALAAHQVDSFIVLNFLGEFTISMGYPVFFVALQAVCGNRRRTMACAIAQFSGILIGSGLGPVMAGVLSDLFGVAHGLDSLRYALICMTLFLVPAAGAFYRSSRYLKLELED